MRTRVKICGLTRPVDMVAAVAAGVDAVGFVFHPASPRAVSAEEARCLCSGLPAFVTAVGLFVDAAPERVRSILDRVPLEVLQFHGEEEPAYCASFGRRWVKALRMRPGIDLLAEQARYGGAAGLLLDTFDPARVGGTGRRFEWERIPAAIAPSIILAGGLAPGNIGEAIRRVRPFGVDVSGGVEASPGVKDAGKIRDFMRQVCDADTSR